MKNRIIWIILLVVAIISIGIINLIGTTNTNRSNSTNYTNSSSNSSSSTISNNNSTSSNSGNSISIKKLINLTSIKELRNGFKTATVGYYAEINAAPELYTAKEFHEQLSEVFEKYNGKNDKKINFVIINLGANQDLYAQTPYSLVLGTFDRKEQGIDNIVDTYIFENEKYGDLDIFSK